MQTITDFCPADRYVYDCGICSTKNGFAQVDTGQDAWYFGTWANPEKLIVVNYCEGDVTMKTADNVEEFVAELRSIKEWNNEHGHGFRGIDPGFSEGMKEKFEAIGLGDLLH